MSAYDKYEAIRKMSAADCEEIYRYAMQRSKEMLSGIENQSRTASKAFSEKKISGGKEKISFR